MTEQSEDRVGVYLDFDNIVISRYNQLHRPNQFALEFQGAGLELHSTRHHPNTMSPATSMEPVKLWGRFASGCSAEVSLGDPRKPSGTRTHRIHHQPHPHHLGMPLHVTRRSTYLADPPGANVNQEARRPVQESSP